MLPSLLYHHATLHHQEETQPQRTACPTIGPKGLKGAVWRWSPEKLFWSKSLNMARNSPTNASRCYSGPPESIPMVSNHFDYCRIFCRFEPGSVSTVFQNRTSKNRKSSLPRGPLGGSKGGGDPLSANDYARNERNRQIRSPPGRFRDLQKNWKKCFRLSRALAQDFGCWASKFLVFGIGILVFWCRGRGSAVSGAC